MAKGYSQVVGFYYKETFTPITRYSSIWVLLRIGVMKDFKIHQMDVKSTFLHGKLKENVYMLQPDGYEQTNQKKFVYKSEKTICKLKQTS